MRLHAFGLIVAAMALAGTPASAQVRISLADGRVTVSAKDATIRQILTEWARVGQTRIVNLDRLSGAPMSLELTNVPEAQALETVLRSVSGYLAAPRARELPTRRATTASSCWRRAAAPRRVLGRQRRRRHPASRRRRSTMISRCSTKRHRGHRPRSRTRTSRFADRPSRPSHSSRFRRSPRASRRLSCPPSARRPLACRRPAWSCRRRSR